MSLRRQEIEQLWTDGIQVLPGRRPINFDVVEQLAQSMDRIGLRHPITVRAVNEIAVHLVAGGHRLEAAKKLGWEKIACVVLEADDCSVVEAELWEIAENLHRADLTKKQRDAQIRRYAQLIAIRDADLQSGQNDRIESKRADKRGHRLEGIASKTAKETGVSVRTVRRALAEDRPKKREQQPTPVQRVEPSEFQGEHEEPLADFRSRAREAMRLIDDLLEEAKANPPDRIWLEARLNGRWAPLPAHDSDTGEIIEEHAAESIASPQSRDGAEHSPPPISDPAPISPAEDAAAASACGEGTPAASSNLSTATPFPDGIIPDMPACLDRRGRA
jgi:ParB-like chromosome segregation protein Spo0J